MTLAARACVCVCSVLAWEAPPQSAKIAMPHRCRRGHHAHTAPLGSAMHCRHCIEAQTSKRASALRCWASRAPLLHAFSKANPAPASRTPPPPPRRDATADCRPGFGGAACGRCAIGFYSPGGNATIPRPDCIRCPVGSRTVGANSTALTDCKSECPPHAPQAQPHPAPARAVQ